MDGAVGSLPRIDYASHPAYGGMFDADPAAAAEAEAELAPLAVAAAEAQAGRLGRIAGRKAMGDLARRVAADSSAAIDGRGPQFETLAAAAAPLVELVREGIDHARSHGQSVSRSVAKLELDAEAHAPVWTAAQGLLGAAGALDAVRDYFGADAARLRGLQVVVNRPGQSWNTELFRDLQLETPPTAGLHIDTKSLCVLKTVIHLDDVGPGQGPFGCIPGSHDWDQDGPGRAKRRACDKTLLARRDPESRRIFASLPEPLRMKASFGGDMLAGDPGTAAMLRAETRRTGPRGQINLFDPEAIHRGGLVEAGERVVILARMIAVFRSPAA
jgi:hypothetical protein